MRGVMLWGVRWGEVRGGEGREGRWQLIYPGCVHSVFAPLQYWRSAVAGPGSLSVSPGPPDWLLPTLHYTTPHTTDHNLLLLLLVGRDEGDHQVLDLAPGETVRLWDSMGVIEPCPVSPPPVSWQYWAARTEYWLLPPLAFNQATRTIVTTVFCLLHQQMDRRNKPKYSEEIFRKIVQLRGSGVK